MIDDALRQQRRSVVGCSDIASIIIDPATGKPVSPWGTPYTVWMSKNFGEDVEETPQMRFGNVAENFVAGEYAMETGFRCFCHDTMLKDGWLGGNVDRLVQRPGEPMPFEGCRIVAKHGLEVKTTGQLTPWTEVPLYYQLQVQGYLHLVPTAEDWDVAVLYRATMQRDTFTIERDPDFGRIKAFVDWWADRYIGHFNPDDPPPAVCEDDVKSEYARRKPEIASIPVTDTLYDAIQRIKEAERRKKEADAEAKELREGVILAMAAEKAEAVAGYDGKPLCTYKCPKPSTRTDYKAVVEAAVKRNLIGGEVVAEFTKTTEAAPRFLVK